MKKYYTLLGALALFFLSGCYVYVEEPYDPRDAYVGSYEVEEWSEVFGGTTYYDVTIYKASTYGHEVWINNFYGIDLEVRGVVQGGDLTIPRQFIGDFEVEGLGWREPDGRIRMEFSIVEHRFFEDRFDECDAVLYLY